MRKMCQTVMHLLPGSGNISDDVLLARLAIRGARLLDRRHPSWDLRRDPDHVSSERTPQEGENQDGPAPAQCGSEAGEPGERANYCDSLAHGGIAVRADQDPVRDRQQWR